MQRGSRHRQRREVGAQQGQRGGQVPRLKHLHQLLATEQPAGSQVGVRVAVAGGQAVQRVVRLRPVPGQDALAKGSSLGAVQLHARLVLQGLGSRRVAQGLQGVQQQARVLCPVQQLAGAKSVAGGHDCALRASSLR